MAFLFTKKNKLATEGETEAPMVSFGQENQDNQGNQDTQGNSENQVSPENQDNPENSQLQAGQSDHNFIIHNMPAADRLRGRFVNSNSVEELGGASLIDETSDVGNFTPTSAKHNFKAVGLVIIAGGLIFIGGLVYLSYRFIIAPTANRSQTPVIIAMDKIATTTVSVSSISSTAIIPTPSSVDLNAVAPTVLDLATTTATTTELIMNEEGTNLTAADLPPLLDSDGDGLNDDEEAILGTSPVVSDTDADGYGDLAEVNNGYDPNSSGKLAANLKLGVYTNQANQYQILYPKDWVFAALNDQATIIFTAPDESLVQISVQDRPDSAEAGDNILSWYESYFPGETVAFDQLKKTATWDGVMSRNGLDFYLTGQDRKNIFVISYISAVADRVVYPQIFQLMIDSLEIK